MANHTDTVHRALTTIGQEVADHSDRVRAALRTMADCTNGPSATTTTPPTTTTTPPTPHDGPSDPTGQAATSGRRDQAQLDMRRIDQLCRDMLDASRRMGAIIDSYNPSAGTQAALRGVNVTNETMWCPNHLKHGHNEPRGQGRANCSWCDTTKRRHGKLPSAALIGAHYRQPRLSATDYARLL